MKSVYDRATDLLKERLNMGFGELRKQYGKTNPYRQEPLDTRQEYYDLSKMMIPEQIQFARQHFDPMQVDSLVARYQKLRQRYEGV